MSFALDQFPVSMTSLRFYHRMRIGRARLILIAICLILLGTEALRSMEEREAALAHARRTTGTLAAVLALQAEGTIKAAEATLSGVVEHLEAEGLDQAGLPEIATYAAKRQASLDWINEISFFDENGKWLFGPHHAAEAYSVADRAYFRDHRSNPGDDFRIGEPLVSRGNGNWIIPITRRVDRADGRFAGVISLALNVDRLLAGYETLGQPATAQIMLLTASGTLLLDRPLHTADLGRSYANRQMFREIVSGDGSTAGDLTYPSSTDGIVRLLSYRRILDNQLVLSVGIGRDAALAEWRTTALWHFAGISGLVIVITSLGITLERQERRRSAAELAATRLATKRRTLAQDANDIVVEFDHTLRCRHISAALLDVCGLTPDRLVGTVMLDALQPVDAASITQAFGATLRGERTAPLVTLLHRPDGQPIWMELVLRLFDEPGEPAILLGVLRDVTARRAAEDGEAAAVASLEKAHAMLLRAETIAHVGHWHLDFTRSGLVWSDEISKIIGWPTGDTQSGPVALDAVALRVHPDDRGHVETTVRCALLQRQSFQADFRVVRPDGVIRHVSCFGEPERNESGEQVGIIGTLQDVNERVLIEHELRHEQKMKTIGRLASGVAHDFNNLLQSITGCLELIGDGIDGGSPERGYLRIALASAERGSYLTHHLLSFARKQVLKPKRVAVAPLLHDMKVLLERTLGPHIEIVADIADAIPAAEVDPAHFQTALLNLGINAGHAMPRGGTLTLSARMELSPAPMVVIAVTDTGAGMDPTTLSQATEPFFTTKGVKGTGLGLSMVNGFAQQSGGEMRMSSKLGVGTHIELRLPGVLTGEPLTASVASLVWQGAGRALLVDDASDVLVTTAAYLAHADLQVVSTATGEQALALLAAGQSFDVLVTDYAMPGIDGVETIHRARVFQPDLPAVIITGFANVEGAVDLPDHVQLLNKPFQRRDLLAALQRAMATTGTAADPDPPGWRDARPLDVQTT